MIDSRNITVIVIPLIGGAALDKCLACVPERDVARVVVLREDMGSSSEWGARHSGVVFLNAARRSVPFRRAVGVSVATTDIVALIEDTSLIHAGWLSALCEAFGGLDIAGAGGPVRISADLPSRYQALGWTEYGAFGMDRFRLLANGGRIVLTSRLPGNNFALRRAFLHDALQDHDRGLIETEVCRALGRQGYRFALHSGMGVTYAGVDRYGARLATRARHGRLYAGTQAAVSDRLGRATLLAKSLLLPFVMTARTLTSMAASGRLAGMAAVVAWVFAMQSAWAVGEAVGAVAGVGRGMEHWR